MTEARSCWNTLVTCLTVCLVGACGSRVDPSATFEVRGVKLVATSDGEFVVTDPTWDGAHSVDLIRISADGEVRWRWSIPSELGEVYVGNGNFTELADPDGGVIVFYPGFGLRLNSLGEIDWQWIEDSHYGADAVVRSDGGAVFVARRSDDPNVVDALVFDADGAIVAEHDLTQAFGITGVGRLVSIEDDRLLVSDGASHYVLDAEFELVSSFETSRCAAFGADATGAYFGCPDSFDRIHVHRYTLEGELSWERDLSLIGADMVDGALLHTEFRRDCSLVDDLGIGRCDSELWLGRFEPSGARAFEMHIGDGSTGAIPVALDDGRVAVLGRLDRGGVAGIHIFETP